MRKAFSLAHDIRAPSLIAPVKDRGHSVACVRQGFSAGIGNWVADEVLYQALIHPEQKASTLSAEQASALHEQMQAVLRARLLPQHTHVHMGCFHHQVGVHLF